MGEGRRFLKSAAFLLPLGFFKTEKSSAGVGFLTKAAESLNQRDYFKELGIKSFINAAAPYSSFSGAQMWSEVIEAIRTLREGEPSVEACLLGLIGGRFEITAWMMEEEEVDRAAKRLREVFS